MLTFLRYPKTYGNDIRTFSKASYGIFDISIPDKYIPNIKDFQDSMPEIGDVLFLTPFAHDDIFNEPGPQKCRVIYTNKDRLWFTVKYDESGYKCSFKWPLLPNDHNLYHFALPDVTCKCVTCGRDIHVGRLLCKSCSRLFEKRMHF